MGRKPWCIAVVLLSALTVGPGPALGATEAEAIAQGRGLFETVCVGCHDAERIHEKKTDRAGWRAVVATMKANGAEIDDRQGELVAAFLAAQGLFEAKCSVCHDLQRPLEKSKSAAEWRATVERMAAKRAGHLMEAEIAEIAAFLAAVRPLP